MVSDAYLVSVSGAWISQHQMRHSFRAAVSWQGPSCRMLQTSFPAVGQGRGGWREGDGGREMEGGGGGRGVGIAQ